MPWVGIIDRPSIKIIWLAGQQDVVSGQDGSHRRFGCRPTVDAAPEVGHVPSEQETVARVLPACETT